MKFFVLLLVSLLILLFKGEDIALASESNESSGAKSKWVNQTLNQHLIALERSGPDVKVVSDGRLLKPKSVEKSFRLKAGEQMVFQERHCGLTVELLSVNDSGAVFKYESRFDERSFGKTLKIENGEVSMPFKSATAVPKRVPKNADN